MGKLTSSGFNSFKYAVETRRQYVYYRLWNNIQNNNEFLRNNLSHVNCRSDDLRKKNIDVKR